MTQARRPQRRGIAVQERILDAAVRALVEHGYAGTSTLRIQEIAEVSRGSLLHQFPSRDALLVAAVQHLAEARFNEMSTRSTWPDDPRDRIHAAVMAMWSTYQQDYFWAATELWLAARHNTELRAGLEQQRRQGQRPGGDHGAAAAKGTALLGHDQTYLRQPSVAARTIVVDAAGIGYLNFDISQADRKQLYDNGYAAATEFLNTWDWPTYLHRFHAGSA